MANVKRCVYCALKLTHRLARFLTSSEMNDLVYNTLAKWISPTPLSRDKLLCAECCQAIVTAVETGQGAPDFGHRSVCFDCGVSTLRTKINKVPLDCKERNIIVNKIYPHLARYLDMVCKACWLRARRAVQRSEQHQVNSLSPADDTNSRASDPRSEGPLSHMNPDNPKVCSRIKNFQIVTAVQINISSKIPQSASLSSSEDERGDKEEMCHDMQVDVKVEPKDDEDTFYGFQNDASSNALALDIHSMGDIHAAAVDKEEPEEIPGRSVSKRTRRKPRKLYEDMTEFLTSSDEAMEETEDPKRDTDFIVKDKRNVRGQINKYLKDVETIYRHDAEGKIRHKDFYKYLCEICSSTCNSNSNLVIHMRKHTGEKPYECNECSKRFSLKMNLLIHIRTHTGEKPYECHECNKCFNAKNALRRHNRIHTGEKPFECNVCKKRFTFKPTLQNHIRTHTGEKPYECNVCKKCFTSNTRLYRHNRIHTGEKPYKCNTCKKCFGVQINLHHHIRTHTGEKPYECDICNKCFIQKGALAGHIRTHTGEKPYQCEVCKKCFRLNATLTKHIRAHTDEEIKAMCVTNILAKKTV